MITKKPEPFVDGSLVSSSYVPQAPFFSGSNSVPRIFRHVITLLRFSYVPRAFFSGQNDVPGISRTPCSGLLTRRRRFFIGRNNVPGLFRTCNSPVEVFSRAAGVFFCEK